MARINASSGESVFQIRRWRGLNESPDGDTKLQLGEASICQNWKVTRDGNLTVRPGTKTVLDLTDGARAAVKTLWHGYVMGEECTLAACDGGLWKIWKGAAGWHRQRLGSISTLGTVFIFGFSEKAYVMTGTEYKVWDGELLTSVTGYRPVVAVGVAASGGGTTLEQVNKLNGDRRCFLSPDGKSNSFQLPESDLHAIDWVKDRATDELLTNWTVNLANGIVTFDMGTATESFTGDGETTHFALINQAVNSVVIRVNGDVAEGASYNAALHEVVFDTAPAYGVNISVEEVLAVPEGTNTIEVAWNVSKNFATQIRRMKYAELFSGATTNRVFVYGDGSNLVYYSGVDYDGNPSAEYFPDMNVLDIGDANTPVTSLIKHYSRLVAFKVSSAYSISASTVTLADGLTTPAFYVVPVNRSIGNAAEGQVQLVLNDPITLNGRDIYRWKNNNSFSSNLTLDERQAQRISDRVTATAARFDMKACIMHDDNYGQELYIVYRDRALVYNYAADAWYTYTNFPARCFVSVSNELYYGDDKGKLIHVSASYRSDDGAAIPAIWQSGSMSFGAEWLKKYTLRVFLGMKPVSDSFVRLYTNSDREMNVGDGTIEPRDPDSMNFGAVDFADFTFSTAQVPRIIRHKLKQKKYAYLQIILESNSAKTTARLTSMDITVRNTVYMRTTR